ncbi:hypothetical protein DB346_13035 [Verrucomicrobia bacterium LW23]|nr:hypothetical protein DB346_13035 [Verrucomicrobia bacterium LW23]
MEFASRITLWQHADTVSRCCHASLASSPTQPAAATDAFSMSPMPNVNAPFVAESPRSSLRFLAGRTSRAVLAAVRCQPAAVALVQLMTLVLLAGASPVMADIPPGPPPSRVAGPAPADGTGQATMLWIWLGASVLSFVVTILLRGPSAPILPAEASPAARRRAAAAMRPRPLWRSLLIPVVWLPVLGLFAIFAMGSAQPLSVATGKAARSEVIGYSQQRNDPGWLTTSSSNDMNELTSYISSALSYGTLGLIALNLGLLVMLGAQAFMGRDEDDETGAEPVPAAAGASAAAVSEPADTEGDAKRVKDAGDEKPAA